MPPVVDFSKEFAYFATLGSSPTAGYGISVEGLRQAGSTRAGDPTLEVDIKASKPGRGCFNATIITAPYVIISFPREALNRGVVNVNLKEQVTDCGG